MKGRPRLHISVSALTVFILLSGMMPQAERNKRSCPK